MSIKRSDISRRGFFFGGLAAAGSLMFPELANAQTLRMRMPSGPRRISIYSAHSEELWEGIYAVERGYSRSAIQEISQLLRDRRDGSVRIVDPRLLDQLYAVRGLLRHNGPVIVTSGYRSPSSNAKLAKTNKNVANNSYHMTGQAVDVALHGVSANSIATVAKSLKQGGVGYYPRSNHVHLDTGRVRTWRS